MSYLKGNYNVDKLGDTTVSAAIENVATIDENSSSKFEDFARAKLGGSIAFVMKNKTFVWEGTEANSAMDGNENLKSD